AVLLDYETDGSPIAHSFQYTRYNRNTGSFLKPGVFLGSSFGKIYENYVGFPIGITAKLMISKFHIQN
ncbi:MAG: hypothetical protein OQK65_05355, partial [Chlorobium sp.]|nr:hypothetical protein [Chlorobium sp.]